MRPRCIGTSRSTQCGRGSQPGPRGGNGAVTAPCSDWSIRSPSSTSTLRWPTSLRRQLSEAPFPLVRLGRALVRRGLTGRLSRVASRGLTPGGVVHRWCLCRTTALGSGSAAGISIDTLRRWDRQGTHPHRARPGESASRPRQRGRAPSRWTAEHELSARNRLPGTVRDVKIDGLLAQVEIEAGPFRLVSVITSEAAEQLGLKPGMPATALVKATSVGRAVNRLAAVAALAALAAGGRPVRRRGRITIFAAASLTDVPRPRDGGRFNFAGRTSSRRRSARAPRRTSSRRRARRYPDELYDERLVEQRSAMFATNRLVLIVRRRPARIHSLADLGARNVKLVVGARGRPGRRLHAGGARPARPDARAGPRRERGGGREGRAGEGRPRRGGRRASCTRPMPRPPADDVRSIELPGRIQVPIEYPVAVVSASDERADAQRVRRAPARRRRPPSCSRTPASASREGPFPSRS